MRKFIDLNADLTEEQLQMLLKAKEMPTQPDEEYPEFTAKELSEFRRVSAVNGLARKKQTICIRINPEAAKIAKSLGKGYTSVLSRIVENALKNPKTIKQYL